MGDRDAKARCEAGCTWVRNTGSYRVQVFLGVDGRGQKCWAEILKIESLVSFFFFADVLIGKRKMEAHLYSGNAHLLFFILFFLKTFFLMWTTFEVFIEFATISLLFYVLDVSTSP